MVLIVGLLLAATIAPSLGSARDPALMAGTDAGNGRHVVVELFGDGQRTIVRVPIGALSNTVIAVAMETQERAVDATRPPASTTRTGARSGKWLAMPRTEPPS